MLTFSVPRNSMCSQKWARPGRSSGSLMLPSGDTNKLNYKSLKHEGHKNFTKESSHKPFAYWLCFDIILGENWCWSLLGLKAQLHKSFSIIVHISKYLYITCTFFSSSASACDLDNLVLDHNWQTGQQNQNANFTGL